MALRTHYKESAWLSYGDRALRRGLVISSIGHAGLLLTILLVGSLRPTTSPLLLAGGQDIAGRAMEVSVVGASEWFRLRQELDTGHLNRQPPPSVKERAKEPPEPSPELLPSLTPEPPSRYEHPAPLEPRADRPYLREKRREEESPSTSVPGSPSPGGPSGSVGIVPPRSTPVGIPAGSEYGRRLQQALVSYYRLTPDSQTPRYVIVRIRIARSGRILSIEGGRLRPEAFIRKSGNIVVDTRVVAALLELDRHPIPFPPDLLPGASEAVVEIYFQY